MSYVASITNMRAALKRNIAGLMHLDRARKAQLLESELLKCLIENERPALMLTPEWRSQGLPYGNDWDWVIKRCKKLVAESRATDPEAVDVQGWADIQRFDAPQPTEEELHLDSLRAARDAMALEEFI